MFDPTKYLGVAYACPCDPPATMDCWELVRRVRADLGKTTPTYVDLADRTPDKAADFTTSPPKGWAKADRLTLGTVAVMGALREHVGVVVGTGMVLHMAPRSRGVQTARVDRLRVLGRLYNDELRFYDYATHNR